MSQSQLSKLIIIVGFLLCTTLIVTYVGFRDRPLGERHKIAADYGGDFTLQNSKGDVSLSDFEGKVVVMYFGFLNCTEACPASMQVISAAFNRLAKDELEHVQALFISVDPERDTVDKLQQFSDYYYGKVVGLTGDEKTIKEVSNQYGVFFDLIALDESALSYTVDHSSRFYMINQQGKLITTMSHSTTPNELRAKIQEMIANNKTQI